MTTQAFVLAKEPTRAMLIAGTKLVGHPCGAEEAIGAVILAVNDYADGIERYGQWVERVDTGKWYRSYSKRNLGRGKL